MYFSLVVFGELRVLLLWIRDNMDMYRDRGFFFLFWVILFFVFREGIFVFCGSTLVKRNLNYFCLNFMG